MLLGFVEIFYNFPLFMQAVKQLCGIPYIYISHDFHLPSYGNHECKANYILPFGGTWTVVNGGIDKAFSHSWGILTQRYAYDFLILDESGHSCQNDKTIATNYYCYGQTIVAPADGVVVQINDRILDSKIDANGVLDNHIKDIRGNFIIIRHSNKEYSFIAHIQPKSILVNKGQKVKQGDVIAKCGNSGNSSEPHVHFHLQDGKSVFSSAGLPITFSNIRISQNNNYNTYDNRSIPPISCSAYNTDEKVQTKVNIHRGQNVQTIHQFEKI